MLRAFTLRHAADPRSPRRIVILLGLTFLLMQILILVGQDLTNDCAPNGIVSFETAGSEQQAQRILDSWEPEQSDDARWSLVLDFPFILVYAPGLALLCFFVARRVSPNSGAFQGLLSRSGYAAGLGALVAGALDLVENVALLVQLSNGPDGTLAEIARYAALIKFGLILAVPAFLIAVGIRQQLRYPLLQMIYVCRFPILLAVLLAGLPLVLLAVPALLANLLYVESARLWVVTVFSLFAAWTVLLALRNQLLYAPARFLFAPPKPARLEAWLRRHHGLLAAALVLPVHLAILRQRWSDGREVVPLVASFLVGLVIALLLYLLASVLQDRFGDAASRAPEEMLFPSLNRRLARATLATTATPAPTRIGRLQSWLPGYFTGGKLSSGHLTAAWFMLAVGVVYGLLGWLASPARFGEEVPELAFVLIILLLLAWILPGASFFFDRYRVPVVLLLVLWATAINVLSGADHYFPLDARETAFPTPTDAFDAREASRSDDPSGPVVLVTASGGGITASLWTAQVLTALEKSVDEVEDGAFLDSLHLVSAVSGGSAGAMFYLEGRRHGLGSEQILTQAGADSLHGSAWGLAYPDFWRALAPFFVKWAGYQDRDRGWGLEEAWRRQLAEPTRISEWAKEVAAGRLPPAVLNATVVDTGEPFLLTPLEVPESWTGGALSASYPERDIEVATAARLSATFPWVSPIARAAPDRETRSEAPEVSAYHLADGGYYDNFGVATAVQWLDTVLSERAGRLAGRDVLLVLTRVSSENANAEHEECASPAEASGWIFSTLGPLLTLERVRTSSQLGRNFVEYRLLQDKWRSRGVRLHSFLFDMKAEAPLSWKLTAAQRQAILADWGEPHNQQPADRLLRCWRNGATCGPDGEWYAAAPKP